MRDAAANTECCPGQTLHGVVCCSDDCGCDGCESDRRAAAEYVEEERERDSDDEWADALDAHHERAEAEEGR